MYHMVWCKPSTCRSDLEASLCASVKLCSYSTNDKNYKKPPFRRYTVIVHRLIRWITLAPWHSNQISSSSPMHALHPMMLPLAGIRWGWRFAIRIRRHPRTSNHERAGHERQNSPRLAWNMTKTAKPIFESLSTVDVPRSQGQRLMVDNPISIQ